MDQAAANILDKHGLTKSEASIYLAVLELGKTNVSDIAQKTGINRRNIYDSLNMLLDKGLLFQVIGEREGSYAAVAPEKLLELIQSKEIALEKIMPDLQQQYKTHKAKEAAVIYKGVEGFKRYLNDILEAGEDVYCLGAKGGWGCDKLGKFSTWFEEQRIAQKIKVYNLFDHEMKKYVSQKKPLYNVFSENRLLAPEFSTNSAVDIFGDTVVTFTGLSPEQFEDDVTLFVITSRGIASAWRVWFDLMWQRSGS